MKPLHGEFKRLKRCPCCQGKFSKHNAGTSKHGNSAARQRSKKAIRKELMQ